MDRTISKLNTTLLSLNVKTWLQYVARMRNNQYSTDNNNIYNIHASRCHMISTSRKRSICYSKSTSCSIAVSTQIWKICSLSWNISSMTWNWKASTLRLGWKTFTTNYVNDLNMFNIECLVGAPPMNASIKAIILRTHRYNNKLTILLNKTDSHASHRLIVHIIPFFLSQ